MDETGRTGVSDCPWTGRLEFGAYGLTAGLRAGRHKKEANRLLANPLASTVLYGGAEGVRTPDLCIANAALSQLSYSPLFKARS